MHAKDGIILIDKPSGFTSHDVVHFIRRRFGFKKVGHAGTLDPAACGLLIILIGTFTKKSSDFLNCDKEYEARLHLGISTDTGDKEGRVIEKKDVKPHAENIKHIDTIVSEFKGEISQVPPMYSAKKIKGKKLYEFARKGMVLERDSKRVCIKEIIIRDVCLPYVALYVKCSKGTYVRQLAHDIGERIGCGAHLAFLRRIGIGNFRVSEALSFEDLKRERVSIYENILQPT